MGFCEYCHQFPHHPRCPLYRQPKVNHYCSICGEGIYDGDVYIENMDGEHIHEDCVHSTRELVEWLGGKYGTMENDCEEY